MTTVTIEEAQARLPELMDRAAAGEEVCITRPDRPAAILVADPPGKPAADAPPPRRGFGFASDMILYIADDFDAPMEEFEEYM